MTQCPIPHAADPDRPRTPAPGLAICPGHARALPERLRDLAILHDELAHSLTQASAATEPVSGTTDPGLALNPEVVDLRDAIRNAVACWCRIVCEDRNVSPPNDDVADMCAFLATHADWLAAQPFIADLWSELLRDTEHRPKNLRALMSRARAILSPSGTRRGELGEGNPCPDCGGGLVALVRAEDDFRPSELWCEGCGRNWPPEAWLRLGKRIKEKSCVVYFLRSADWVKIGYTGNLEARLKSMSQMPESVVYTEVGGPIREALLHDKFSEYRRGRTEWFKWCDEIREYIGAAR